MTSVRLIKAPDFMYQALLVFLFKRRLLLSSWYEVANMQATFFVL